MVRVRIEGNMIVLRGAGRREVMGVVDVDGMLWLRDVPRGASLWKEGQFIGLRDKKIFNHARGWQAARRFGKGKRGEDVGLTA